MAAIVVSRTDNYYDPNSRTPLQSLMLAYANQDQYALAHQMKILGKPQFIVYGTTDTNMAGSTAFNLTTLGVTFPDGTQRSIRVVSRIADDNGQGLLVSESIVDGGATPIIVTDSASADPLVSGLAGTPTGVLSVSTADVIFTAVGIADVDCRWVIEVYVGDLVSLAYIPTT